MKDKDKKKLYGKFFKMTLMVLFAIFITIFISNEYGYFEYQKSMQVTLTQEQIKKFEEDVKNGKNVNVEDYLKETEINYQTPLSQAGLDVSNFIAGFVKKGVDGFFSYINKLITENN